MARTRADVPAHRARRSVVTAVLAASLGAACTAADGRSDDPDPVSPAPTAAPPTPEPPRCPVDELGTTDCGVLWGVATLVEDARTVADLEASVGRSFDFVYRYHDVNDEVPDASERTQVEQGKLLHVAIAARDFSHPELGTVTWADVADGEYDEPLRRQARGIASLGAPVYVTFEQEADQSRKVAALGTPEDYVRAWRHLWSLYDDEGVDNAVWVWVMTGIEENLDTAARMWPGNRHVDWISWNVYNQSGCRNEAIDPDLYVSFEEKMRVFRSFLDERGPEIGIDLSKPMMISESGSAQYEDEPERTAGWYAEVPEVLERHPEIRAFTLWDSVNGGCDYRFERVPVVLDAVRTAGLRPRLDTGAVVP